MLHGHAQPNSREKLIHKLRELIYAMRVIMIVVSSVHAIETWLISIPTERVDKFIYKFIFYDRVRAGHGRWPEWILIANWV